MKNRDKGINVLLILVFVVIVLGTLFMFKYGGLWQGLTFLLGIFLLLYLMKYRTKLYKYQCLRCKKKFKIDMKISMVSLSLKKDAKYLKCPYCSYEGWAKEVEDKSYGKK